METIGEKLRIAREAKKLTIKDVVKETNINPIYLNALEEEKFDKFPSETYIIGFLRSYAEFLKIDVEAIIQAYKGYKIGESITPLEELTKPTSSSLMIVVSNFVNKYRTILYIGGIAFAVILVIAGFRAVFKSNIDTSSGDTIKNIKEDIAKHRGSETENIRYLQLNNDKGYILVYKNQVVQFPVDKKEVGFLLKDIKGSKVILELRPERHDEILELEKPKTVKIEGASREIIYTLMGLTENRAKIMVKLSGKENAEENVVEEKTPVMEGDNTTVTRKTPENLKIVFEAEFTQKSFIELYLDGVRKKRGFVGEGSKERWEASEYIQIKIGNAGGIKARINGKDYSFGSPGQVVNKTITWKKDVNNPNVYHVVVKDW